MVKAALPQLLVPVPQAVTVKPVKITEVGVRAAPFEAHPQVDRVLDLLQERATTRALRKPATAFLSVSLHGLHQKHPIR